MRRALPLLAFLALGFLAVSSRADEPLRTAADRLVDIQHIRLDLQIDLVKKTADGKATLRFRTLRPLRSFALDAVDFSIQDVQMQQGEKKEDIHFDHDGKKLTVDFTSPWKEGTEGTLNFPLSCPAHWFIPCVCVYDLYRPRN